MVWYGWDGLFVICVVCSVVLVFGLPGWLGWCLGGGLLVVCLHIRWLWGTLFLLSFFSLDLLVVGQVGCLCLVGGCRLFGVDAGDCASVYMFCFLLLC